MPPFKNIGKLKKRRSPREIIAERKMEELDKVKERYQNHKEDQGEKEKEKKRIAAFDKDIVERKTEQILREEGEQKAHKEQDEFYRNATSDGDFYQNKRRKELYNAVQKELREIRNCIERGIAEDVEAILQEGKFTYFDREEVIKLITHATGNMERNRDLREKLDSTLNKVLEKAEEEDRIERVIWLSINRDGEKSYREILDLGAFKYFSQQEVAKRIAHSGHYFQEELFNKALQLLQQEGRLEEPQKEEYESNTLTSTESQEDSNINETREVSDSEDEGAENTGNNDYARLLKNTDVYDEGKKEKARQQERRESQEITELIAEAVYGTKDVSEVETIKNYRDRKDNAFGGIDPYYIDRKVNIHTASKVFRDLLERSYKHVSREEVAEKIRDALKETGNDRLYTAFRRAIRDIRRKEEYALDYDYNKNQEDKLISAEDEAIRVEEGKEILHQWQSMLDRSFLNMDTTQRFAKERRVCVRIMQDMLSALAHRKQPFEIWGELIPPEEYQRSLINRLLKGSVYLEKGKYERDEFKLEEYFKPEEVVAVLLHALEEKEDQEMYDLISEVVVNDQTDNQYIWCRDMKNAWQSLTRRSFLNNHTSQEFADGRKKQMQRIQQLLSGLVNNKQSEPGLLHGGGFGGDYYGYKYTTPKEVAAICLLAIEMAEEQEAYDILMQNIVENQDELQREEKEVKDQMEKIKSEIKKYRTMNLQRARTDSRHQEAQKNAEQVVDDWKKRVGI